MTQDAALLAHKAIFGQISEIVKMHSGATSGAHGDIAWTRGPNPSALFNLVFRLGNITSAGQLVRIVDERRRQAPATGLTVFLRDRSGDDRARDDLKALGFVEGASGRHYMRARQQEGTPTTRSIGFRHDRTVETAETFLDVACKVFLPDPQDEQEVRAVLTPRILRSENSRVVVGCEGDTPVASAWLWRVKNRAVLSWVGVLSEYRGRGIEEAISRKATDLAFELGVDEVVLCAMPPKHTAMYESVGYQTVGEHTKLVLPPTRELGLI